MFNDDENSSQSQSQQYTVNPKTGRKEYVFANLELVYPSGDAESGYEFCFEELRAMKRGLINRDGFVVKTKRPASPVSRPTFKQKATTDLILPPKTMKPESSHIKLSIFQDVETSKAPVKIPIFDDSEARPDAAAKAAKKTRREEKANRTRKIEIMEVKAEPQTSEWLTFVESP